MVYKIDTAMKRLHFLKIIASLPLIGASMKLEAFEKISNNFSNTQKTPLLFIGHGHPINALLDNDFTQHLSKIGTSIEACNTPEFTELFAYAVIYNSHRVCTSHTRVNGDHDLTFVFILLNDSVL